MTSYRDGKRIPNYARCVRCKVTKANGAQISSRGLCSDCGIKSHVKAVHEMHDKTGPAYERWLEVMRRKFVA